jgi:hypothetical protein
MLASSDSRSDELTHNQQLSAAEADALHVDALDAEQQQALALEELNADNDVKADGTRERNLTLWEAAHWPQKVYAVFETGSFPSDVPAFTENFSVGFSISMLVTILASCASVLWESYPEYRENPVPAEISSIEVICVVIFTFDMFVRFFTCPSKIAFVTDFLNWVDLIAIAPFYLTDFGGIQFIPELRMVRVLRLVRILRVLRAKKIPGLQAVLQAVATSFDGLTLFMALGGIALLISATSAYYAERGTRDRATGIWWRPCSIEMPCYTHSVLNTTANATQPSPFYNGTQISPFQSIPDSFWWACAALSTVGYGDVVPTTGWGKAVAALTMIAGVFIIAFPTMILSGNFDAAHRFGRLTNFHWATDTNSGSGGAALTPRSRIARAFGWSVGDDADATGVGAPAGRQNLLLAGSGRSNLKPGQRQPNKRDVAVAVGCFLHGGVSHEVRRDANTEHSYSYSPLFTLATCDDGGPCARVIWGVCGQPTLVQLTLVLDHVSARDAAHAIVDAIDPSGRVRVDLGAGFQLRHYSSTAPGPFKMLPSHATAAYRNSDFPVYFAWGSEQAELQMLTEDEVAEVALSHLLGTTLFLQAQLAEPSVVKRLAIVQQVIHHTCLQRELETIAKSQEYGGDLMAYISRADVLYLLQGVSKKVIVDTRLSFEAPDALDADIVDAVLARVRQLRVNAVPAKRRNSIYNAEFLLPSATVYEFPMSLFRADELDEVEEDALGYAFVKMRPFLAQCHRIDIQMDYGHHDDEEDEEGDEDDE